MRGLSMLAVLVALTLTGACSGGDPGQGSSLDETPAVTSPRSGPTTGPATGTAPGPSPACAVTGGWNTAADEQDGQSTDQLIRVRAGRHDCFDRVVFEIDGSAPAGFLVNYVPTVLADGSGEPVPVAGGAALQVIVRASIKGYPEGEMLANVGDRFYSAGQLTGWRTLREVRFAGFFEGQSTTAIGVRAKLPFRAFTTVDAANKARKVVVDIAHK